MGFFINIIGSRHWLVPITWEEYRYRQSRRRGRWFKCPMNYAPSTPTASLRLPAIVWIATAILSCQAIREGGING